MRKFLLLAAAMVSMAATVQASEPRPDTDDVTDLRLTELFKLPIGPRGLEPSAKLLSLRDRRVRVVGYMVHQESATPGELILAPLPVTTEEISDGLADDLPVAQIRVYFPPLQRNLLLPYTRRLLQVEGKLDLGARDESDGRVSGVRVLLESVTQLRAADVQAADNSAQPQPAHTF